MSKTLSLIFLQIAANCSIIKTVRRKLYIYVKYFGLFFNFYIILSLSRPQRICLMSLFMFQEMLLRDASHYVARMPI